MATVQDRIVANAPLNLREQDYFISPTTYDDYYVAMSPRRTIQSNMEPIEEKPSKESLTDDGVTDDEGAENTDASADSENEKTVGSEDSEKEESEGSEDIENFGTALSEDNVKDETEGSEDNEKDETEQPQTTEYPDITELSEYEDRELEDQMIQAKLNDLSLLTDRNDIFLKEISECLDSIEIELKVSHSSNYLKLAEKEQSLMEIADKSSSDLHIVSFPLCSESYLKRRVGGTDKKPAKAQKIKDKENALGPTKIHKNQKVKEMEKSKEKTKEKVIQKDNQILVDDLKLEPVNYIELSRYKDEQSPLKEQDDPLEQNEKGKDDELDIEKWVSQEFSGSSQLSASEMETHVCTPYLAGENIAEKMSTFTRKVQEFGYGMMLLRNYDDAIELDVKTDSGSELEEKETSEAEVDADAEAYADTEPDV